MGESYLLFERESAQRKTAVVRVRAVRDKSTLGWIKWFGRWRQYAFFPEPGTVFNKGCMVDINNHIGRLMAERRGGSQ